MKSKKIAPSWHKLDPAEISPRVCGSRCRPVSFYKVNYIFLNQVAQGLRSFDESRSAFGDKAPDEQLDILRTLAFFCREANANRLDAQCAINQAGLTAGFRPLWRPGRKGSSLGLNFGTTQRGKRILNELWPEELSKQDYFLMRLFTIADANRRVSCGTNCLHWWHNLGENPRAGVSSRP